MGKFFIFGRSTFHADLEMSQVPMVPSLTSTDGNHRLSRSYIASSGPLHDHVFAIIRKAEHLLLAHRDSVEICHSDGTAPLSVDRFQSRGT